MVGAFWGKQSWSIHQPMKAIGIIGFMFWGAFTAVFNLSVGHIRSIYEEGNIGLDSNPWTEGFENFLPYLLGKTDGIEKNAKWAANICEISSEEIINLARDMASKRTMISVSWSLTRQDHGEQPFWMVIMLASMICLLYINQLT